MTEVIEGNIITPDSTAKELKIIHTGNSSIAIKSLKIV